MDFFFIIQSIGPNVSIPQSNYPSWWLDIFLNIKKYFIVLISSNLITASPDLNKNKGVAEMASFKSCCIMGNNSEFSAILVFHTPTAKRLTLQEKQQTRAKHLGCFATSVYPLSVSQLKSRNSKTALVISQSEFVHKLSGIVINPYIIV